MSGKVQRLGNWIMSSPKLGGLQVVQGAPHRAANHAERKEKTLIARHYLFDI